MTVIQKKKKKYFVLDYKILQLTKDTIFSIQPMRRG